MTTFNHDSQGRQLLHDLQIKNSHVTKDNRGLISTFEVPNQSDAGAQRVLLSYNFSKGTVRGLHVQMPPRTEVKIVSCVLGSIFDVVLDLRTHSPTYGLVNTFILDSTLHQQLWVPKGVAHGYQTLTGESVVHYVIKGSYSPIHSLTINPLIQESIKWPLEVSAISENDLQGISLKAAEEILSKLDAAW